MLDRIRRLLRRARNRAGGVGRPRAADAPSAARRAPRAAHAQAPVRTSSRSHQARPTGGDGSATEGVRPASAREIEFAAYAEDCSIVGFLRLQADRLSDALNEQTEYVLRDVMVVALRDGSASETKELVVARNEIHAVRATGPRGDSERRTRRRPQPITVRTGPYLIHGYMHTAPGGDPIQQFGSGRVMVPLTDAWMEYAAAGESHRGRVGTLVVNRELIDWIVRSQDEEVRMPDLPAESAIDPQAKDLTGYIVTPPE